NLADSSRGPQFTEVPPRFLGPTATPGILGRMLRNLLRIYLERRELEHALSAVDLLLVLTPRSAEDLRTRATLYERLEGFAAAAAAAALRSYRDVAPGADDAADTRSKLGQLDPDAPTLH